MRNYIINHIKKDRPKGFRLTPQRAAILEYLDGNTCHPTAEDIYKAVKMKFPMISFATVYKMLELLKQKKYIRELSIDRLRRRYDPDIDPHHHLVCVTCRKVVDIWSDLSLSIPDEATEGFEVIGNHVEFYGTCDDCGS